MSRRRNNRVYHDLTPAAAPALDASPMDYADIDLPVTPEEALVQQRLASLRVDKPAPATRLVDQIPEHPRLPATLSIGSHAREPVPEIPDERELAQAAVSEANNGLFRTFQDTCPPPADAQYTVVDQGVSGPDFFRVSMYNVPTTGKLRESTRLPLGLYLRPFAAPDVPAADFTEHAQDAELPPRCHRCRAYMNPSMRFTHGGERFVCNMCLFVNDTPAAYFQPVGADGRRVDFAERPELAYGTYDFVVVPEPSGQGKWQGSAYAATEPAPFRHMFVVEAGRDAVQKSLVRVFAEALRSALPYIGAHERIAVMTFTSQIQTYRVRPAARTEMLVSSPGHAVVPPDVFVDVSDPAMRAAFEAFLDQLPALHDAAVDRGSCYGQAVDTALDACGPGRVTSIMSMLPSVGDSRLALRDTAIAGITSPEQPAPKELFESSSPYYRKLAAKFKDRGCGCDILAVPGTGYLDLANISRLAKESGGQQFYYPRFVAERDSRRFIADLLSLVAQPSTARETQLRIRCSTGLQVEMLGPELGFMDSKTTVVATLAHDGQLDPKLDAHFQAAILYTAESGERRIRVCNLMAGVTTKPKSLLKFVDIDTVMAIITRQSVAQLKKVPAADIRRAILAKVEEIFGSARLYAGQGMPSSQLLMPVNLRELIMFGLALAKTPALGSRAYSSDARVDNSRQLATATPEVLALSLYPRIYDVVSKAPVRARFASLQMGSRAFLLFEGTQLYLFLGAAVRTSVLQDLLGVDKLEQVSPYLDEIPEVDSELNASTRELCGELALRVGRSWLPVQIVRQGLDGAEYQVRTLMVEDTINDTPAYVNYIVVVHDKAKQFRDNEGWF